MPKEAWSSWGRRLWSLNEDTQDENSRPIGGHEGAFHKSHLGELEEVSHRVPNGYYDGSTQSSQSEDIKETVFKSGSESEEEIYHRKHLRGHGDSNQLSSVHGSKNSFHGHERFSKAKHFKGISHLEKVELADKRELGKKHKQGKEGLLDRLKHDSDSRIHHHHVGLLNSRNT